MHVIVCRPILIHSSFCELKFMLPAWDKILLKLPSRHKDLIWPELDTAYT